MLEIECEEFGVDTLWIEVREEVIEVVEVRWIIGSRDYPIKSDQYRHLDEEWET